MGTRRMMGCILCGASALSVAAFSQMDSQGSGMSNSGQMGSNKMSSMQMKKDKMFVMKAAEGGLLEVQLGQLAAQKASDADVMAFGQKMVDDHTALNDAMKPIAMKMGVTPPTMLDAKDQTMYDKLNGMSGMAFDKAYLKAMVADHHKDLKEFTMEANTAADPDLKQAVSHGRDVIQEHTTMVEKLAKEKMMWKGSKDSMPSM